MWRTFASCPHSTSTGLASPTYDTAQKLRSKHPSATTLPNMEFTPPTQSISLSKEVLFRAIRQSPRGSGCVISGWHFDHFKSLIENDHMADIFHFACSIIASGALPTTITKLMSSACLIALPMQKWGRPAHCN